MSADTFEHQFTEAFDSLARAGAAVYRVQYGVLPDLSHVAFKFSSPFTYDNYVTEAHRFGKITKQHHNGREIVWVRLNAPLQAGKLKLEWLELVDPAKDPHHVTGIATIGYHVPGLEDVVKIPSTNPDITFRYMGKSAAELALA